MDHHLLIKAEQQFREFADSMPHILWTAEPYGVLDYLNKVYTDYTGVILDVESQNWVNALHPNDVDRCIAAWNEAIATGNVYSIDFRIFHLSSQQYRWNAVSAKPVRDKTESITKWYGIATDIHERKVADEKANLLARRLDTTLENMSDGFIMMDEAWRFTYINAMAERFLRRPRSELLGKIVWDEFSKVVGSKLYQDCQHAASSTAVVESEYFSPLLHRWLEIRIYPSEKGVSIYFRDITPRKTAESEIARLAFHDQLTGLPNRQLLTDRLQHAITTNKCSHYLGAVMFIDLDNFKSLNDTQGHHKGDRLLQELARRISSCVREIDTVGRLGGDEFVVLLEQLSNDPVEAASKAELIGAKIRTVLNQPCDLNDYQYIGTASIGITLLDHQVSNIEQLLKQADMAMYRAKSSGRNEIRFYDPAMQTAVNAKMVLETSLRDSIQNGMFTLHYQPQVDRQRQTIGVEALVRWLHPEHKDVPPSVFIPLAEETGLIVQLGAWVLKTACVQLVKWAKNGLTAQLRLSVNVSAHQFHHPNFVKDVLDILCETGANPDKLKIELTESALISDMNEAVSKITLLKDHGIRFSLDDFGTGYSSLSYLRYLPLEQLKIDRSFVSRIASNANDAAIVQAIIAMGHNLGLTIIAEGVETEQQIEFLSKYGCNAYQGFLFSKPVTADVLTAYLRTENRILQQP
jgi:diguanylate cyclase (GGDEF)-like protein/PAS domain S-box-containing protein